jgi:hypothetical protein
MGAIQKKDAQVHPSVQVSDVEDVLGELATKGEVSTTTSTKKNVSLPPYLDLCIK